MTASLSSVEPMKSDPPPLLHLPPIDYDEEEIVVDDEETTTNKRDNCILNQYDHSNNQCFSICVDVLYVYKLLLCNNVLKILLSKKKCRHLSCQFGLLWLVLLAQRVKIMSCLVQEFLRKSLNAWYCVGARLQWRRSSACLAGLTPSKQFKMVSCPISSSGRATDL